MVKTKGHVIIPKTLWLCGHLPLINNLWSYLDQSLSKYILCIHVRDCRYYLWSTKGHSLLEDSLHGGHFLYNVVMWLPSINSGQSVVMVGSLYVIEGLYKTPSHLTSQAISNKCA